MMKWNFSLISMSFIDIDVSLVSVHWKFWVKDNGYDYQACDVIINEAFVMIMSTCIFCASVHAHSYEACVLYLYVWILSILFVLLFIDFSSLDVRIASLFYYFFLVFRFFRRINDIIYM